MPDNFIGPRRPDPTGRYESPWGDIRDVASPFAAAAGAAGGGPWAIIFPIALSILGGLLSEDPQQRQEEEFQNYLRMLRQAGIRKPYQSKNIATFDDIIAQALTTNMGRYANWGVPEGMNVDLSFLNEYLANPSANRSIYGTLPGTIRRR
jgi:hypothetical protein